MLPHDRFVTIPRRKYTNDSPGIWGNTNRGVFEVIRVSD